MKKLLVLLLVSVLCVSLCTNVFAQSSVQSMVTRCAVSHSGACSVELAVTLCLDEAVQPVFPIPGDASEITLNGDRGNVTGSSGGYKLLSLSSVTGGQAGTFTFHLRYTLPGVITSGKDGLILTLPLLCGFAYPVSDLSFSVSLPSQITTEPVFFSSYYQELIAAQLDVTVSDNTLRGHTGNLKDHETLTMTLPVTDDMFPQLAVTARVMGVMDMVVLGFAVLALLYYLLTMRPKLSHREIRTTAPDGVSAGDLQMWFTGSGIDFSLLVVTWAQLGYLRIQITDDGRVLLHKRMDMANERSRFENRCFRNLFGLRQTVEGCSDRYARLCRDVWSKAPGIKEIYRPLSGNPKIFRAIGLISGTLSGFLVAGAFAPHSLFLKILLALVSAILCLGVQAGGGVIPRRQRLPRRIGLGCSLVWLLLGLFSGEVPLCVLMILFQTAVGLAAVCGGRRTVLGHQVMEQIRNLRRHMRFCDREEMEQLLRGNPNYFHEMLPYALALGVDRRFARHFDRLPLQDCNYLSVGNRKAMKASDWANALRTAVETLDAKATLLPLERFKKK